MSDSDRLRLLILITDLQTGGVPLHVYRLARRLVRAGVNVNISSLAPPGPVSDLLRRAGIRTFACDARPGLRGISSLWRLGRLIRRIRPDIIHAFLFHANLAARLVNPLVGFPPRRLVCEIQTVEIDRPWHLLLDNLTCRLCHVEVGNSPSVVRHLRSAGRLPASRVRLVRGGVDVGSLASAKPIDRAALGVPAGDPLVLWVGRLDPVKGLEALLRAARLLRDRRRVHLLLAGDGPLRPRLEAQIAQLGLSSCVRLLGRRDDVPSLMAAAQLFVFPSRTEGLPNALLEAMAAGLAVVATDVPGCRDVVESGRTGLLVPPDDPSALAAAMDRLLGDPPLASRLAAAARQRARDRYSLSTMVRAYHSLYRSVVGVGRR